MSLAPEPTTADPTGGAAGTGVGRLRRMRLIATGLLAVMAAVFVAASWAERRWPAVAYLRAFAEAGVIGACADWFAVTALFRRPLGLPIPHTAIVAQNQDRIGQALGRFIADNFLTVQVLDARLRQLELAAWGGEWLRTPGNARALALRLAAVLPDLMEALPSGALRELAQSVALTAARAVPAAPTASKLLAAVWNEGRAQALIERAADMLQAYLTEHQEVILEKVQSQSYAWLPGFVDKMIARKITAGVIQLLADVRAPDHPWRLKMGAAVEAFVVRLAEDPQMRARGEALKQALLDDPALREHVGSVWAELERGFASGLRQRSEDLATSLERWIVGLGDWLSRDMAVQRTLNTGARTLVRRFVAPRRHAIGGFVAQVVSSWDTASVVERLELQVGPDLQYIRISGTLVGGLVGLAVYALARAVGLA